LRNVDRNNSYLSLYVIKNDQMRVVRWTGRREILPRFGYKT